MTLIDLKAAPDEKWLPFLKMVFGGLLLVILASLSAIIALGKVEQSTSHGLDSLLGGLLVLSGGFAQWAFTGAKPEEKV